MNAYEVAVWLDTGGYRNAGIYHVKTGRTKHFRMPPGPLESLAFHMGSLTDDICEEFIFPERRKKRAPWIPIMGR